MNVLILCGDDILWKTKNIPTVLLSPGDNFVNLEMTKVQLTPENPSVKDAKYIVRHMIQKLSGDKSSVLNDYEILEEEIFSGKIGEETTASVKNYEGFTAQGFVQKAISADGSTIVEIRYNRNSYKVAFDSNGGSGTVPDIETFYGAEFQIPENSFAGISGYKSSGNTWNSARDGKGTTYKAGEKASSLISENGGIVTLFAVWIEKDAFSITYYDSDGSIISEMSKTSFKESEEVDLSNVRAEKQGYTFAGWTFTKDGSETTTGWNSGEKKENVLLYAKWTANTDTKYTVMHLFEGTDGTYSEDTDKTQSLEGTTGGMTSAAALAGNDITGFTAQGFAQKTINADGSTVVEIKYERKTVTLTFNYNDGTSNTKQISGKYGMSVSEPESPERVGYAFLGWYDETTESVFDFKTAITADISLSAKWLQGFVKVKGGTFDGTATLTPSSSVFISGRSITITDLYVCDHEVTQAEYETYCKYGRESPSDSYGKGDNYPAYYVSWYDAVVYCNLRSIAEGLTPAYSISNETAPLKWTDIVSETTKYCGSSNSNTTWNSLTYNTEADGYRLPTEAEWEYIARGGNKDSYTYSGSNNVDYVAWYTDNSGSKTHEIKTKNANRLGIYDMSGNVYEWCYDWYNSIIKNTPELGATSGSSRVIRGGSWYFDYTRCVVSTRSSGAPGVRGDGLGFRVVRNAN